MIVIATNSTQSIPNNFTQCNVGADPVPFHKPQLRSTQNNLNLLRTALKLSRRAHGTEFFCEGLLNRCACLKINVYNRWTAVNEVICIVLGIYQRYFSSKKYSVEMFSAYKQEVNLQFHNFQLYYLRFCLGQDVCTGNFSFKICGVVPWCGSVWNITLLHTHTQTILSQNFTNNFFLLATRSSHTIF